MRFIMRFNLPLRATPHPATLLQPLRNLCDPCGTNKIMLAAFFVASLWTCHAGVVAQLNGTRLTTTTTSNVVWQSLQGAHWVGDASDWVFTNHNAIANLAGAIATPLVCTNAPSGATVRYLVFAVKTSEALRMRETLVSSRRLFRLDSAPANELLNQTAVFETGGWCNVGSWKINNVEGAESRRNRRRDETSVSRILRDSEVFTANTR